VLSISDVFSYANEIENEAIFRRLLEIADYFFWSRPDSRLLYHDLISLNHSGCVPYEDHYLELVYLVLIAWGMDNRGAKLARFPEFLRSLQSASKLLQELRLFSIRDLSSHEIAEKAKKKLERIFLDINILYDDNSSHFVTYTKTLHLLLPHLISPMDRANTLKFYKKSIANGDIKREFEVFFAIQDDYWNFINNNDDLLEKILNTYKDKLTFNETIPKICDNLIIGYSLRGNRIISNSFVKHCSQKGIEISLDDFREIEEYFQQRAEVYQS